MTSQPGRAWLSTAEAARLRWPRPDTPSAVRQWLTTTSRHLRRHGVQPLKGRTDDGMRMWPAEQATAVMTKPAARGNFTRGQSRHGGRRRTI